MQYNQGYFRTPTIHNQKIIFASDRDLWLIDRSLNMRAQRITKYNHEFAIAPSISPSGEKVAYTLNGKGHCDVYLTSINGGVTERISFFGDGSLVGWENDHTIIVRSAHEHFHYAMGFLYLIDIRTLDWKKINIGPANSYLKHEKGQQIIGRFLRPLYRWKRYRGGTAGSLWYARDGKNDFKQLFTNLNGNFDNPQIIGERLYFISDHEGHGNIYSSRLTGTGLKRHTDFENYYIRNFSYSKNVITFESAGDLYTLDLINNKTEKLEIEFATNASHSQERFYDAHDYLQNYIVDNNGKRICFLSRGKLFLIPPWSGSSIQLGAAQSRYKYPLFVQEKKVNYVYAIKMEEDILEKIVRINLENLKEETILESDIGKIIQIEHCPGSDFLFFTTNRNQLLRVNTKTKQLKLIDQNEIEFYRNISFSPDGKYLTITAPFDRKRFGIKIYDTKSGKGDFLFEPILYDGSASFSPCGQYLAFLGIREFNPTYSEAYNDYSYTNISRPYIVSLNELTPHPLKIHLEFENDEEDDDEEDENKKIKTKIDFKNIEQRIVPLPVEQGGYSEVVFCKDRIFFDRYANTPLTPHNGDNGNGELCYYDLKKNQRKSYQSDLYGFRFSQNRKYIIVENSEQIRLCETGSDPTDGEGTNKKDGWIDMDRIKFKVNPRAEWRQMYDEAWLLQKENFWDENMCDVDWEDVYFRYLPMLDKVNTREELSDLLWEMQGDLGTSHCYEAGGDYNYLTNDNMASALRAHLKFNSQNLTYEIESFINGSSWIKSEASPLLESGVELEKGDEILSLNGISFQYPGHIYELLEGMSSQAVTLQVKRKNINQKCFVTVTPAANSSFACYRMWVEKNKKLVHELTDGKIGYIHIPDMYIHGHSEFFRSYLSESQREGLIVDVRFNRGGNLSEKFLKELMQKTLGFDNTRWFGVTRYPSMSVPGPVVGLTNELAGSDGDIFSQAFKMLKIGKLIGKRTWGGVVGIWPRFFLNDGSYTTQPQFSFWFNDIGYTVENKGVTPDIEVEITPKDWINGTDTQLLKAISEAKSGLKESDLSKKLISLHKKPSFKAPKLPRRI